METYACRLGSPFMSNALPSGTQWSPDACDDAPASCSSRSCPGALACRLAPTAFAMVSSPPITKVYQNLHTHTRTTHEVYRYRHRYEDPVPTTRYRSRQADSERQERHHEEEPHSRLSSHVLRRRRCRQLRRWTGCGGGAEVRMRIPHSSPAAAESCTGMMHTATAC